MINKDFKFTDSFQNKIQIKTPIKKIYWSRIPGKYLDNEGRTYAEKMNFEDYEPKWSGNTLEWYQGLSKLFDCLPEENTIAITSPDIRTVLETSYFYRPWFDDDLQTILNPNEPYELAIWKEGQVNNVEIFVNPFGARNIIYCVNEQHENLYLIIVKDFGLF